MSQTKGIRGAGESAPEVGMPGVAELPVAIGNYRTEQGWQVAHIAPQEDVSIQAALRARNCRIVEQSLEDARRLLADCAVAGAVATRNVIEVALYLSDRRTVHASRVYDEFLARKIATERGEMPDTGEQKVCYDCDARMQTDVALAAASCPLALPRAPCATAPSSKSAA